MTCYYCNYPLRDGGDFCPRCGKRQGAAPPRYAAPAHAAGTAAKAASKGLAWKIIAIAAAACLILGGGAAVLIPRLHAEKPAAEENPKAESVWSIAQGLLPAAGAEKPAEEAQSAGTEHAPEQSTPVQKEEPWLPAYQAILDSASAYAKSQQEGDGFSLFESSYYLYDIDKDGVPELTVKQGTCEADFTGTVYTWRDGQAVEVGQIHLGHSSLGTDPDENGMLLEWAHMGYMQLSRVTLSGGSLQTEQIFEEDTNATGAEYTRISDLVPGAGRLDLTVKTDNLLYLNCWEEVTAWAEGRAEAPAAAASWPQNDENWFDRVISENGPVLMEDSEAARPFSELLREGVLYPYTEGNLHVVRQLTGDLNGDGQMDCVLQLDDNSSYGHYGLLLHEEGGVTYGTFIFSLNEPVITSRGLLQAQWGTADYPYVVTMKFFFSGAHSICLYCSEN